MSLNVNRRTPEPVPLPRGRHKLSREHVLESQRARLIGAMLDRVAAQGYADTTVSDVVSSARVSRNAFYELFADREACFIAACDELLGEELLAALYALASEPNWIEALRKGLDIYLRWWRDQPELALAYLVELPSTGRRAFEQRDRTYARFAAMFDELAARARAEQPELPPLPSLTSRLLVTSITEIVAQETRAGRVDRLAELADELLFFIVKALADDATARRALAAA